ncbi:hypothetical protein [Dactylosporangium sp. CA-233914]|uniref:hypothetical protein n=1 Tax=Dactylosporangium sp. CA-233914 TaxID=3239934 RepID=UPI003D927B90
MSSGGSYSTLAEALVDDAGLFPPEQLDMESAVARHRRDLAGGDTILTHRFVCPVPRLTEMGQYVRPGERFQVIALASGLRELDELRSSAVQERDDRLKIVSVETALPTQPSQWPAVLQSVSRLKPLRSVNVEVPLGPGLTAALDLIAERGLDAKVRCGGVRPDLFPSPAQLASFIEAAIERGITFKATAGLHHAIGYIDAATGFRHYGFLNLLLAVARAQAGGTVDQLVDDLLSQDRDEMRSRVAALAEAEVAAARTSFTSFGSCSTSDPVSDLAQLRLLPRARL